MTEVQNFTNGPFRVQDHFLSLHAPWASQPVPALLSYAPNSAEKLPQAESLQTCLCSSCLQAVAVEAEVKIVRSTLQQVLGSFPIQVPADLPVFLLPPGCSR